MSGLSESLQRLADEVDGWLDLECPERALERVAPLLEAPPARRLGLALRTRALIGLKRHADALVDIAELRPQADDPEWLDLTEAWCRKRTQDLPGAVRCMEQLLARNDRSAIGHFNLGCYLALAGDTERAIAEVAIGCRLDASLREFATHEHDLDALRNDPRFQELVGTAAADDVGQAAPAAADDDDDEAGNGHDDDNEGDGDGGDEGDADAGDEGDDEGDDDDDGGPPDSGNLRRN